MTIFQFNDFVFTIMPSSLPYGGAKCYIQIKRNSRSYWSFYSADIDPALVELAKLFFEEEIRDLISKGTEDYNLFSNLLFADDEFDKAIWLNYFKS